MPDGYSNHTEDDEQGQATDLDDVTNEVELTEENAPTTQRIQLAGGGRSVEVQLEGIDAEQALILCAAAWERMGPQRAEPIGFGAEALHTERSGQDE